MNLGASGPTTYDTTTSNTFVEAWVYFNAVDGFNSRIYGRYFNPTNNGDYNIRTSGAGLGFTNGSVVVGHQTAMQTGVWTHIAFSLMTNGTANVFVNGVVNSTGGPITVGYTPTHITLIGGGPTSLTNAYIRDLRVVQGGVVPVANFTPLASAPFSYASPGYVPNMGTTVFTLLGQFVTYNPSGKYGSSAIMRNIVTRYTWPFTPSINSGVTISFWIKFDVLGGWISGSSGTSFGDRYYSLINGTPRFELVFVDNTTSYKGVTSSIVPSISTWYHVTYVFGNGSISQYINGNINGTRSDTPQTGLVFDTNLAFGGLAGSTTGTSKFELDDLRIYNTALTAAQVQSVYSSQGAPAPSRAMPLPRLAWDFNGTTTDYVSGLTGTTTGTVSYNSSGKYGQSIILKNDTTLNSTSNSISWSPLFSVNPWIGQSICSWVKFIDLPNATNGSALFAFGDQGSGGLRIFVFPTSFYGNFYDSGTSQFLATSSYTYTISTGVWYHYAMTSFNGATVIYFNGLPVGYGTFTTNSTMSAFTIIGTASGLRPTSAEYDDLRIFDRALTSAQVQAIYNQQGVPGRGVQTKSPIQPGYIYELNNNTTNFGTPSVAIINSSNPDPRTYMGGNTARIDQWNTVPNLLNLWDTTPFKYYMIFLSDGYTYQVNIPTAGTYKIDILFVGPGGGVDSFFISIDSDADTIATSYPSYPTSFTWLTALTKTLTAGAHTVKITAREPCGVAAIRIVPSGGTEPTLTAFRQNFTGTPLFTQLSPSATSSAVGAFSLRAVNGTSARAVQVRPQGQFPPGPFVNPSGTVNGPYTETITGYAFGGTGTYTVLGSSRVSSGREPWKAFDGFDGGFGTRWISQSTYTANSPYTETASTIANSVTYPGEWLQIQLPQSIVLLSYSIYPQATNNIPLTWNVFASNDGSTWTVIDQRGTAPTAGQYNNYTISGTPTSYSYYRIGCYVVSSGTSFAIVEMKLYGAPPNTNTDFYADRLGNLLTAPVTGQSLANWLGGATGYVTTWYNQIQPGQDVSATVAANQPTIDPVNKTIVFNGSTHSFSNTATTGGLLAACVGTGTKYTYTARFTPNATYRSIVEHNSSTLQTSLRSCLLTYLNYYGFNGQANDTFDNLVPMTLGTQYSAVMRVDNSTAGYTANGNKNIRIRSNGADYSGATGNYATLSLDNYWFTIGRKGSNNSEFFSGPMKNIMVFKDAISDADTAVLDAWQQSL
jgi:hypothetical protein